MRPLFLRRVRGHSMEPSLREGNIVAASGLLAAKPGNIVVARVGNIDVVKRLTIGPDNTVMLKGDNHGEQHDLPLTAETKILGRVFWPRLE